MMRFLKKKITKEVLKKALKSVGKVADNAVLGGVVTNALEDTKDAPKGKIDIYKLLGALIPIVILIAILTGVVSVDEAKSILKLF